MILRFWGPWHVRANLGGRQGRATGGQSCSLRTGSLPGRAYRGHGRLHTDSCFRLSVNEARNMFRSFQKPLFSALNLRVTVSVNFMKASCLFYHSLNCIGERFRRDNLVLSPLGLRTIPWDPPVGRLLIFYLFL